MSAPLVRERGIAPSHRHLLLAAACTTYLLITMGGIVCVTGAAKACPDWPGCYGRIVPPLRIDAIVEYTHRFIALCSAVLIVAAAVIGRARYRATPWVSVPPAIAIVLVFIVAAFGAAAVLGHLSPALAAIDLGLALSVLALMVAACVAAFCADNAQPTFAPPAFADATTSLLLTCIAGVFAVLVTGVMDESNGSLLKCLAWPIYSERSTAGAPLHAIRYVIADVIAVIVAALTIHAWSARRTKPVLRRATAAVFLLLAALLALGFIMVATSLPMLTLLYIGITAAFWAALVALAMLQCFAGRSRAVERDA